MNKDSREMVVFLYENGEKKEFERAEKYYGVKQGKLGKRPVVYRIYNFRPTQREIFDLAMHLDPLWSR